MVPTVPPSGVVCETEDTDDVDEVVMRGVVDEETETVWYPPVVEVGVSEPDADVDTGIGENERVVNVTTFDVLAVSRAVVVSGTSVVAQSVGGTVTVVVKRMTDLPPSVEVAASEVTPGVSETDCVGNTSVKFSPRGKLNAGMSERAGVVVAVGSVVVVPLGVELGVLVISSVEAGAAVVMDSRILVRSPPTGMANSGISEDAGVLVAVGEAVEETDPSAVVVVATEVLDPRSPSAPPLLLLSSEESSPLIPPVARVSLIRARASSSVVHEVLYTPKYFGELRVFRQNAK